MCFVEGGVVGNGGVDSGCKGWIKEIYVKVDMQYVVCGVYVVKKGMQWCDDVLFVQYVYVVYGDFGFGKCCMFCWID